jgi:hypothetical protein
MMGGIVRPSALAVLRFITSSNLVGSWLRKPPGIVDVLFGFDRPRVNR